MQSKVCMAYPTSPMIKELKYKVSWSKPNFPIDPDWTRSIASCWIDSDGYCTRVNILDRSADRSRLANRSNDRFQSSLFAGAISWSIERSIPKLSVRNRMRLDRSADRSRSLLYATECDWIDRLIDPEAYCSRNQAPNRSIDRLRAPNRSADRLGFLISQQTSDFSTVSCQTHLQEFCNSWKHTNNT